MNLKCYNTKCPTTYQSQFKMKTSRGSICEGEYQQCPWMALKFILKKTNFILNKERYMKPDIERV